MLFDLKLAPVRMLMMGLKLWAWAEVDHVRLKVKNILGRRPMPAMPMPTAAAAPSGVGER